VRERHWSWRRRCQYRCRAGGPIRGTSLVRPVAASATGPGRQEQALARWRRAGAGRVDAAPARHYGARAGSDDSAGGSGAPATRNCCWPRRLSRGPASQSRCQQASRPAGQQAADAVAAGLALVEVLYSSAPITSAVCCSPQDAFNLLAAMALWAGLRIDHAELHAEVLVVAAQPERKPREPRSSNAARAER
jgi:hypothetical protein